MAITRGGKRRNPRASKKPKKVGTSTGGEEVCESDSATVNPTEEGRTVEEARTAEEEARTVEEEAPARTALEEAREAGVEVDSERTESEKPDEEDVGDDIPMNPLKMYFRPVHYNKTIKLSSKCYIAEAVENLELVLKGNEKKWFHNHPQFKHFFHVKNIKHKWMGMWLLIVRMACVEKKKECWFIVNGVPIRYSLQEFALITGLYCHGYPRNHECLGSLSFVGRHFPGKKRVTYEDVVDKFLSMKGKGSSDDRLKMGILYLLCSTLVGKKKTGKKAAAVEPFFLRAVDDLELCKTFPWGVLHLMKP